jgi:hypothetical protein
MAELHPKTTVFGNGWYTSRQKINNIPEPCWIAIDTFYAISDHCPTIYIQVEPQIIIQSEQYIIENCHKYHTNMLDTNSVDCICKDQLILNGNIDIYENKEQLELWIEQINTFIHTNN